MHRRIARFLFVSCVGTLALALGVVTAMIATPPGRGLLARTLSAFLDQALRGTVQVGAISGSFLYDLTFDGLVVRDTSGALLADIPRLDVSFRLPNLLAGRIVLNHVRLHRPTLQIIKHRNGRLNFNEVLRLGEGKGGGTSPLIEFRNVSLSGGEVAVLLPWSPPDSALSETQRTAALAAERAKPGRVIEESIEGYRRRISISDLTTQMSLLRISTPDRKPLRFEVDSLAARVSDPAVTITDINGAVQLADDSLVFSLSRGAMPQTEFAGGGTVSWPEGPLLYYLSLEVPRLSLEDVRWVSPKFPAMIGRTLFSARTESATRTAYVLRDLHLTQGPGRIDGEVVALDDKVRGLGVRDMNLALTDLDVDAVRPFLDTLPFEGTLTGTLTGEGFFDRMNVAFDWAFSDARVAGPALSRLVADGRVVLGGPQGFIFDSLALRRSDIDLRTVRLVAPAVALDGRLELEGLLLGPWKNVTFNGTARHQDGDRPASSLVGLIVLDTRGDTLGLATDVLLDSLVFEGLRGSFPAILTEGGLRGRVISSGTLARLKVDADVEGTIGRVRAQGAVTLLPPRLGADSLTLQFTHLDMSALRGGGPPTSLAGQVRVSGVKDSLVAPSGELLLHLSESHIREFRVDSAFAHVQLADSLVMVDTLHARFMGGMAFGAGTLGYVRPHEGRMAFAVEAETLSPLDSIVYALTGIARDTSVDARRLDGTLQGTLVLSGALDSMKAQVNLAVRDFQFQRARSSLITGSLNWLGGGRPRALATIQSDSIMLGARVFREVRADVAGWADSLTWRGGAGFGSISRLSGGGRWWRRADRKLQVLSVDSLTAALPGHRWLLNDPIDITLSDSVLELTPVELDAEDGSGVLHIAGTVPRASPGELTVEALGIDLRDLYGILQWDTAGVAGSIALDARVAGTAAAPSIRGTGSLADARFGDFRAPFVQGVIDYASQRLEANLFLWRTGQQVLQIEARLPLDLALKGVPNRQLAGPLSIEAQADSVDLALLEAFTPDVRNVSGNLAADVRILGTWEKPQVTGGVDVKDGAVTLPGLGVRYEHINGRTKLTGDSIRVEELRLSSGRGRLDVGGLVRLERLTHPILGLTLRAKRFRAVDVKSFLTLEATGDLTLTGPLFNPLLTGRAVANSGVLYFADLLTKRVVDLEDPAHLDLIDTLLIQRQKLGEAFQTRFLDSLRIENFSLAMGEDFWLRSSEANIKLEGNIDVSKSREGYRLSGTLTAARGNYALKIGPVTRDFTVEKGTVRYLGTPDLNAELDIQARHIVNPVGGSEEIPVIAKITGTIRVPKLKLESAPGTNLSDYEIISYLMFGKPSFSLASSGSTAGFDERGAFQAGVSLLSSALSTEIERTLISDFGLPIDFIEIRPGEISGVTGTSGLTRVAAGWQIGRKTFLTLNTGVCRDFSQLFNYQSLGASVEFRFSREWRLQTSVDPVQTCFANAPVQTFSGTRYQVGFDILWEREY